jgi:hypothetical protein
MYEQIDLLDEFAGHVVKNRVEKSRSRFEALKEVEFTDALDALGKLYDLENEFFVKVFPSPAKFFHRFVTVTLPPIYLEQKFIEGAIGSSAEAYT